MREISEGQERPGEVSMRCRERPGEARNAGEARRDQERPGEARRGQERPGEVRRDQERPGEARLQGVALTAWANMTEKPNIPQRKRTHPQKHERA